MFIGLTSENHCFEALLRDPLFVSSPLSIDLSTWHHAMFSWSTKETSQFACGAIFLLLTDPFTIKHIALLVMWASTATLAGTPFQLYMYLGS